MKIKNRRGSIFIIVLLLIIVFITLGGAFVVLSISEGRVANRERMTYQAFDLAEAGIERALYDLRQDFVNASGTPSWSDGNINSMMIGPNTANFYSVPYTGTSLNGGSYSVQFKNVTGLTDSVWIQSTGVIGDSRQTIQVYAKIFSVSPWNNAIFAGAGSAGSTVSGNVDINGSVHILGTGLTSSDYVVDLGGTAELIGNNYNGLPPSLLPKIPALPTTTYNGETVSTLSAILRVKHGKIGLSGSSSVGEVDVAGNGKKEMVDAVYSNDGFGGNQGTNNVHSDNGWSNGYDLGDTVTFPSLNDPYPGYATYKDYLKANAYVISDATSLNKLANITPDSDFNLTDVNGKGSISIDDGELTVSGTVYIDNGGNLNMNKEGSDKTITYTGSGAIYVSGSVQVNVNLITDDDNSFPNNIIGIMTPNQITFDEASINVMGIFYAEDKITAAKQTNILGTLVSNYFDMGTNVPAVYQVPEVLNHLPAAMIGQGSFWLMKVVSWQKQ